MLDFTHLYIYPDCRYRKNLECGLYPLGSFDIPDFYGKNIKLHAIVGRNGSGKSSLLDIMIRMINNVGALMCKKEKRDASDRVRYARHIHADLAFKTTFVIDGDLLSMAERDKVHECKLCVRDTCLWLEYDKEIYWLSDPTILVSLLPDNDISSQLIRDYGTHFHDYSDMHSEERKHEIASKFFYTIATNYSMLGFQSADYDGEESMEYDDEVRLADNNGNLLVDNQMRHIVTASWVNKNNWITGVFHKNDGYMCPLVLNPYRDGGVINMKNEASLTVSRLSALLIMHLSKRPLIDDYQLDYISYEYKDDFYKRFDAIINKDDKEKKNLLADGGDLKFFKSAAIKEKSWSWTILDELNIPIEPYHHDLEVAARLYIAYKILNIAATYPHYAAYRKLGKINKVFDGFKQVPASKQLRMLIQEIASRKTHVEQKFHQALHFIKSINQQRAQGTIDLTWLEGGFTYEDYSTHIPSSEQIKNLDDCMRILPPGIFRQTIYMKRVVDGQDVAKNIPFSRMSSGQKQMLYQLSALMYHCVNLNTVPLGETRYHNLNIILDEIEVCFHPEYQRMFITRMLELLCDTLHLNDIFGIHIWLTTHSPFILSDIPEPLITYMKNGHRMTDEEKQADGIMPPMAANVSDLLHQSFFLQQGFIGELVRNKIKSLIKFLSGEKSEDWTVDGARTFIKNISEPYISHQLKRLYRKCYEKDID